MHRVDVDTELAAGYAPLVRVWPDDPPGDPDTWLKEADLLRYDEWGTQSLLCPGADRNAWPDDAVTDIRPHESSSAGLALVPRARAPKLVPTTGSRWYGLGGAWGRPRLPPVGSLDRRTVGGFDLWLQSTGPLGPGPTKRRRSMEALALARSLPETRGG